MSKEALERNIVSSVESVRSDLIQFMKKYLQWKSVNPVLAQEQGVESEAEECQKWVIKQLNQWPIFDNVDSWSPQAGARNVVAKIPGSKSEYKLLFNGHSDVVPVSSEEQNNWDSDKGPWEGKIEDGVAWGRGAADMKGGNVAALFALKALENSNIELDKGVLYSLVTTEENGGHEQGVDSIFNRGYSAPLCIIPEPTDMAITPQILGEFYFKLTVKGLSTHICKRHYSVRPLPRDKELSGVNAIDKMRKILNAFEELENEWGIHQNSRYMPPGSMTLNISQIDGGETFSALADSCTVVGSVLFNPEMESAEVIQELKDTMEGVIKRDYWLQEHKPQLEIPYMLDIKEPVDVSEGNELFQSMKEKYHTITESEPELIASVGTSDGNYLNEKGVTPLQLGLNQIGVHGVNERVSIDNIVELAKIFALTVIDTCGTKE